MGLCQAVGNGLLEVLKVSVIRRIQTGLLDKFPYALNQIQVGRVRGQVQEFNLERGGHGRDQRTFLVAGVIQDQGYGHPQVQRGQMAESLTHRARVNVGVVRHRDQLVGKGVQRHQDIEALAPRWRPDKHADKAPEHP